MSLSPAAEHGATAHPTYEAYRDVGEAWIGAVPAHWAHRKLRYVGRLVSGGTPSKSNPEYWVGTVPWVSPKDMKSFVITESQDQISNRAARASSLELLAPGTVLFVVRGMILAHSFPVAELAVPATINQDLKALVIEQDLSSKFVVYWLQGASAHILSLVETAGHGTKKLRTDLWRSISAYLPPLDEQSAIADFLDRETEKIDALIAKKERLIELLQEKRTALITQAVTKGLNPDAPMKDSGVEWLGEIPAHWAMKRLRHLVYHLEQGWSPDCENREADQDEWGVLRAGCVNGGIFRDSDHKTLPAALEPVRQLEVARGDLLMSRASGSRDLVGSVAVVEDCRPGLLLCDKLFRLHVDDRASERLFLAYLMGSRVVRWQIERVLSGGSGLANNISQDAVRNLLLPHPPAEEQEMIANRLTLDLERLASLVAAVTNAAELLRELRAALISAAVTGKIDVREKAS